MLPTVRAVPRVQRPTCAMCGRGRQRGGGPGAVPPAGALARDPPDPAESGAGEDPGAGAPPG
eukprot:8435161-Pyramimonas_sp.AAC.1